MLIGILSASGAIQDLPWPNIWLADNPVEVVNQGHPCVQQE